MKRRNDIFLISGILILSLVLFLIFKLSSKNQNLTALVYYKNDLVLEIDLSVLSTEIVEYQVEGENGEIIIAAKHNAIAVIKEESPYHLCSQQGFINSTHQALICLPNKVYIKIVGNSSDGVDVEV